MLLKELTTSSEKRIAKINDALQEAFGFTLNADIDADKLAKLRAKVSDDLYKLKLNQATARDAEYVEKVLVKEGLDILRESAMLAGPGGRAMERVVGFLADFVRNACEVGDDYEEAIYDAMKQYRSSKYRFSDDHVEYELRNLTADCNDLEECSMYESEQLDELDRETYASYIQKAAPDAEQSAKQGVAAAMADDDERSEKHMRHAAKRMRGVSRASGSILDKHSDHPDVKKHRGDLELTRQMSKDFADGIEDELFDEAEIDEANPDRYAERDWVRGIQKDQAKKSGDQELELSLVGDDEDDGDDYFSYQAKKGRKTEMKENYVKTLRKLLEAETAQAESLIAAKSFSQELQDMIEKLGRLVNEDLPAVSEQMRDSHGADVATGFEDTVSGTLNGIMDSLRSSKQELDNSVSAIADGGMPEAPVDMDGFDAEMDLDVDADLEGDVELDLGDDDLEMGDELGGMDAAAGPEDEELGRAKKESVQKLQKKIVEMQEKIARAKKRRK